MGEQVALGSDPLSMLLGDSAPPAAAKLFDEAAPTAAADLFASSKPAAVDTFNAPPPNPHAVSSTFDNPSDPARRASRTLSAASLFAAATQQESNSSTAPQTRASAGAVPAASSPSSSSSSPPSAVLSTSGSNGVEDPLLSSAAQVLSTAPQNIGQKNNPLSPPPMPTRPAFDPLHQGSDPTPSIPPRSKRAPDFRRIDNIKQSTSDIESVVSPSSSSQPALPTRPNSVGYARDSSMILPMDRKVATFMKGSEAKTIQEMIPKSLSASVETVRRLYLCGAWSKCLEVVQECLVKDTLTSGQNAQLFRYELHALVRTGKATMAMELLESKRGRKIIENAGSNSATLTLLTADVEYRSGKKQESITRLSHLVRQLIQQAQVEGEEKTSTSNATSQHSIGELLWCSLRQLVGYLVSNEEYSLAISVQKMMLDLLGASEIMAEAGVRAVKALEGNSSSSLGTIMPVALQNNFLPELRLTRTAVSLLHLNRIYLRLGDTQSANRLTEAAAKVIGTLPPEAKNRDALQAHVLLNRGLVEFSSSNEDKASSLFEEALELVRVSLPSETAMDTDSNEIGSEYVQLRPLTDEESLREVAITAANNLAVCALHRGTIFEAMSQIEAAIQEKPRVFLHPQIVHNLKILYVVSLKPAAAAEKNALIARIVELYYSSSK